MFIPHQSWLSKWEHIIKHQVCFCEDIPYPMWAILEIQSYVITYVINGFHFVNIFPILWETFFKFYVKFYAITYVITEVHFVKTFLIQYQSFLKFNPVQLQWCPYQNQQSPVYDMKWGYFDRVNSTFKMLLSFWNFDTVFKKIRSFDA